MKMPIITLESGLKVANFSSPHEFRFTDGSVLPACSPERATLGKLKAIEVEVDRYSWTDIDLEFRMSDAVEKMLQEALQLWFDGKVNIVIVPFPVLNAVKEHDWFDTADSYGHPFRTIRSADRVKKINHADRFCC